MAWLPKYINQLPVSVLWAESCCILDIKSNNKTKVMACFNIWFLLTYVQRTRKLSGVVGQNKNLSPSNVIDILYDIFHLASGPRANGYAQVGADKEVGAVVRHKAQDAGTADS